MTHYARLPVRGMDLPQPLDQQFQDGDSESEYSKYRQPHKNLDKCSAVTLCLAADNGNSQRQL